MVIDKLENLEKYVSLNPLFAEAVQLTCRHTKWGR